MRKICRSRGKGPHWRISVCASLALVFASGISAKGGPAITPSGANVAAGSASIVAINSANTLIVQKSPNLVINWQSLSLGAGASLTFQQPNSAAIALNRVTGPDASIINGNILANGQIWLINSNGILFGAGSQIDVGGLLATTSDIKDADFLSGQYDFGIAPGNPDAAVINEGSIKAASGGSAILSATRVANEGVVQAKLGNVVLGGAKTFSVTFDGDSLIQYQIGSPVSEAPKDADGTPATAIVSNSGMVTAQGGTVLITARAARGIVDNVINSTGIIQAQSASLQNGEVVLDAGDGSVNVSGTVDVSGPKTGEAGGTVTLHGQQVTVADGTQITSSGNAGGGTITIGTTPNAAASEPNTQSVTVGKAILSADATVSGKGGAITIISNGEASIAASISAKGIAAGGMVETSGSNLNITADAHVDTSASAGPDGAWLLDPLNADIDSALASSIVGNLGSTNVTISASNDITVNAPLLYTSANSLTLLAGHDLTVNASIQNAGTGNILAVAGWDGVTAATNILTTPGAYGGNGGSILIGGAAAIGGVALGSSNGDTTVAAQDLTISASNGYAQLGYEYLPENPVGGSGNATVILSGNLTLIGGDSFGSYAQIGNGGREAKGNLSGNISVSAQGAVSLTGGSALDANAQIGNGGAQSTGNLSGDVFITSGGDIALSNAASINAGGTGDALVLATTGDFVNQSGGTALSVTGGGRWLVFLSNPANNMSGGLSASPFYNRAFDFSTNSYLPVTSAGNRFVYVLAPTLTVTVTDSTKVYGTANPAFTATIAGGLPGDFPAGVFTGAPSLSTSATASSSVGNYAIVGSLGTLSSNFNYGFQFVSGSLRIDPATVTASLTGTVQKIYDGTTSAALGAANYQLSGILAGDNVTLNNPANGNYSDQNVGSFKVVSVGGLALLGPASGNYVLSSTTASGAIGTITPVTVVAFLTGSVDKNFNGTTSAVLVPANYDLSGALVGDTVTLNDPAIGSYDSQYVGTGKTVSVSGLALVGPDSGNYILASTDVSGAIGIISASQITDAIGNSYTSSGASNASLGLGSPPPGGGGSAAVSDATSDTGVVADDAVGSDSAAYQVGKSLSGVVGAVQSSSSVVIGGLLRQFSAPAGTSNPHGVPPYGQVYSSWGNEAFWQ
jgi:filamentous hemagglutinin family protein